MAVSLTPDPAANEYAAQATPLAAATADPGVVIPFNAPSVSSFEQALSQAQAVQPSSPQSATVPTLPQADPTAQGLVPFSLPQQQPATPDAAAQGLTPFTNSALPAAGSSVAGVVPFTALTPGSSSPAPGLVPFGTNAAVPLVSGAAGTSVTPFGISATWLPVTEPMAEGLIPFGTQTPQLPQTDPPASGLVPFPASVAGAAGYPLGYMLVPVALYPGAASGSTATANGAVSPAISTGGSTGTGAAARGLATPSGLVDTAAPSGLHVPFDAPVTITQGFGPTSDTAEPPFDGYAHFHTGVDFAVPSGTAIGAMGSGRVVAAGWDSTGFGNRVIVDHGNGILTLYAHLEQVDVHVGQSVTTGQELGLSGSTGNSSGPHLHFGVQVDGTWVNPVPYLQQPSAFATAIFPVSPPAGQTTPSSQYGASGTPTPPRPPVVPATPGSTATALVTGAGSDSPPLGTPAVATGTPAVLQAAPATYAAAAAVLTPAVQQATTAYARQVQPIWVSVPVTPPSTSPTAPAGASGNAPAAPLGSGDLQTLIRQAATKAGVPSSLLAAMVQVESGGDPHAVSPAGAKGLLQLMDGTATQYGVSDPFDAQQNLQGGAQFLHDLLSQFNGNTTLAVAAYNAGPGAVAKYHGIPPYSETRAYVTRVLALAQQYAAQGE